MSTDISTDMSVDISTDISVEARPKWDFRFWMGKFSASLHLILKWWSLSWFLPPVPCFELQEWLVGIYSAYSVVLSPTYHHSASQSWCADDQWRACRVRGKSFPVSVQKNFQYNRTHRKERSYASALICRETTLDSLNWLKQLTSRCFDAVCFSHV